MSKHYSIIFFFILLPCSLFSQNNDTLINQIKKVEQIIKDSKKFTGYSKYLSKNDNKEVLVCDSLSLNYINGKDSFIDARNGNYKYNNDTFYINGTEMNYYSSFNNVEIVTLGSQDESGMSHAYRNYIYLDQKPYAIRTANFCAICNPHYQLKYYLINDNKISQIIKITSRSTELVKLDTESTTKLYEEAIKALKTNHNLRIIYCD